MSLITLAALAYLVSPVLLICGWAQWRRQPKQRTVFSILSLVGIVLATTSALLAIAAIAYAQIHRFPHQDPLLIKLYRVGMILSRSGLVFGIGGVWRPNSVRWYAPASALSTLAFWMLAATSE
jgi:hypothetical protein